MNTERLSRALTDLNQAAMRLCDAASKSQPVFERFKASLALFDGLRKINPPKSRLPRKLKKKITTGKINRLIQ